MANKEVRTVVVSFRVTATQAEKLKKVFAEQKMVGVRSANTLARKLTIDFVNKKLIYPNKEDALFDSDITEVVG